VDVLNSDENVCLHWQNPDNNSELWNGGLSMNYKRQNYRSLYCHLRESGIGCVLLERYTDFLTDCRDFKDGRLLNLIVIGHGGIGKSMSLRQESGYLSGVSSAVALYSFLFENRDRPIILDDVEAALKNQDVVTILKGLTDTSKPSVIGWNKQNSVLRERGVPASFRTTSPTCILLNDAARYRNPDVQALLNRSRVVVFDPPPVEVFKYAEKWWCDLHGADNYDVLFFCRNNLERINQLDCRDLFRAVEEKKRGQDWMKYLLDQWSEPLDPESEKLEIVRQIALNPKYNAPGARAREWHRRTRLQRNSWQRHWRLYQNLYGDPTQDDDLWDGICDLMPEVESHESKPFMGIGI
jgi:hypothetical protein